MDDLQPPYETDPQPEPDVATEIGETQTQETPTEDGALTPSVSSDALDQMIAAVRQLQSDFQFKIQYDKSKDRTIDTLHNELQVHREGLTFKILLPLVKDIVQLYDDIDGLTAVVIGDESGDRIRLNMRDFLRDIESMLERYGFELFQSDEMRFDRRLHQVARVEATSDPAQNEAILVRRRRGVRYEDRVIRRESVVVAQYKAPTDMDTPE